MVRVSSAHQAADDRNGIPRQLATTRQYCAAHNMRVVEESHTLILSLSSQIGGHNARRPTLTTTLPLPPPGMRGRHTSGRYVSAR